MDQVFVIKQMSEKCIEKGKSLYVAYMDLEKAHDRVDRNAMLRLLSMYGVNGILLHAVRNFYVKSESCERRKKRE